MDASGIVILALIVSFVAFALFRGRIKERQITRIGADALRNGTYDYRKEQRAVRRDVRKGLVSVVKTGVGGALLGLGSVLTLVAIALAITWFVQSNPWGG